jgi:cell division protein FtsW (lipid II flippase)
MVPLLWSQMSREQRSRVTAVLRQNEGDRGDLYHLHQAKQMLALGGAWGSYWSGPVVDDPVVYHVPEGATDSIVAVLGERFGLAGVAALLGIYVLLVGRMLAIAERTREPFGRLVAAGVAALFAVETLINTGMMVGLLPITGLSLPLVSYGGSGLVSHSLALGLAMNIGLRGDYELTDEPFLWRDAA